MQILRYLILLCLTLCSLNYRIEASACDCDLNTDLTAICCDGSRTYDSKCDAKCNGGFECNPGKGICEGRCCRGACKVGACSNSGKPGKDNQDNGKISDCNPDAETEDNEDIICCNGDEEYKNKCDANVNGGITACKPEKGVCSGTCCSGQCVRGACNYSGKPGKEGEDSGKVSECDPDAEEEDTICCNGDEEYRNKCDANVNGDITECKPEKGMCSTSCCSGLCEVGGCGSSGNVGIAPLYFGATSLTQFFSDSPMQIIVIEVIVFAACFLCLGVCIGSFYLRKENVDVVPNKKISFGYE